MVKGNLIKRKLKTDLQRYVFKAIPQGFSSTTALLHAIKPKVLSLNVCSKAAQCWLCFLYNPIYLFTKYPFSPVLHPLSNRVGIATQILDCTQKHAKQGTMAILRPKVPRVWYQDAFSERF